jgi:hypothetical protein
MSCHFNLPDNIGSVGYDKHRGGGLDFDLGMCSKPYNEGQQ